MTESRPPGLFAHLSASLASLLGYFRARAELAALEGQEFLAVLVRAALALGVGCLFLCFGYAFLWIGLIALVAAMFQWPWGWCVLGVGVLHLLATLVCAWLAARWWKKPFFPDTLEEFRKDQQWLNRRP